MKIKFNPYERTAGIFVLAAIVGSIAATVGVAVKNGWFEEKVKMATSLKNADGVREGTHVQMAGLRAGTVTHVELKSDNEIDVSFEISEKFKNRVREDSIIHVVRPFIIGEKVLDVSVGSDQFPMAAAGAVIKSEPTSDIMDLVSGKTMAPYLETITKMMENLRFIAEKILDPQRSKGIVKMFDDLQPTVHNLRGISTDVSSLLKDVNSKKQLAHVVDNLVTLTDDLNVILPGLTKDSPDLGKDVAKIAKNMAILTDAFGPLLKDAGPEIPRTTKRVLEALDETVITLKSLQKSFLLRGSVREVKEEEAIRDQQNTPVRAPASQK